MRKLISIFMVLMVTVVLSGTAFADNFKATDKPWGGRSLDAGNKYGYEYIQDWMNVNGYASINAKNDYSYGDGQNGFWDQGQYLFRIESENAGYADQNILGYYTQGNSGKKLTELFSGTDGAGDTESRLINKSFGLYLSTPDDNLWYTYRPFNSGDQKAPHALIYTLETDTKWLVCWEDLNWKCGDKDYNDMMVTVTATPEPISAGLFLLGGGALAIIRKRRKAA